MRKRKNPNTLMGGIRKFLKPIAAFFIVNFITSLFAPNIAYALTSGPTSPDYSSFEPVDTTDMVNLLSGDLAYNIPLLEVPGPAGGYPVSLSYHAGIMPKEEASWVGLGWTLNPGAINRSVNGYADDFKNVEQTDRFYWEGGETHIAEIGVSAGVAGVIGSSVGVSIGTDTYMGFGVGGFAGLNFGLGANSPLSIGLNAGVDPWGNPSASVGLGYQSVSSGSGTALRLGANVGVSTNFQTVGAYGGGSVGVNYDKKNGKRGSTNLVGGSISASGNGIKPSLSVGGGSARITNGKQGQISTSGYSITLPLPLVHLGYKYQRYWIDQTDGAQVNGALNFPIGGNSSSPTHISYDSLNKYDYDMYSLQDSESEIGSEEFNQPDRAMGGSFPQFDNYNVVAQGVTGSMRPYIYQQNIIKRSYRDGNGDDQIIQYPYANHDPQTNQAGFRFINDFSNQFVSGTTIASGVNPMTHSFGNVETGQDGSSDYLNGVLNGASRKIEYFKNSEILDALESFDNNNVWPPSLNGYIETNSSGFNRDNLNPDQIGAFIITNETGVNYHFTLPAHSYDEYSYSENIDEALTFNEYKSKEKYAYTWHLTGITGPDYVDRGGGVDGSEANGQLDEEDWGYWVEFDYGKWTSQYFWRTPGEGLDEDLDSDFENFSEGTKEVYYLDAIRTKTHTAYFVKDVREDAKSSLKFFRNIYAKYGEDWVSDPDRPVEQANKDGGFTGKMLRAGATLRPTVLSGFSYSELNYYSEPTKSLKLDKIYLVDNSSLNSISKTTGSWPDFNSYTVEWTDDFSQHQSINEDYLLSPFTFDQHKPDNVLDVRDINENTVLPASVRVIDFDNDSYTLVPNTPNSSSGKLTLGGLKFLGKEGAAVLPRMSFSYLKENTSFDEDKFDIWGMYKNDYQDNGNSNVDRMVSTASAADVDAWSMNEVVTSLGSKIKIEYESDEYQRPGAYSSSIIPVENVYDNKVHLFDIGPDLDEFFHVGNAIKLQYLYFKATGIPPVTNTKEFLVNELDATITAVVDNGTDRYLEIDYGGLLVDSNDPNFTVTYSFRAGNVSIPYNYDQLGGGLRVKSVAVETDAATNKTEYSYDLPNGNTSGVTSYEPVGTSVVDIPLENGYDNNSQYFIDLYEEKVNEYKTLLYDNFLKIIYLSHNLPSPGVMYQRVKVEESVDRGSGFTMLPQYSIYEFETFDPGHIGLHDAMPSNYVTDEAHGAKDPNYYYNSLPVDRFKRAALELKDYTSRVGNLKSVTLYDDQDRLISKTENLYLHDQLSTGATYQDRFNINMNEYETMMQNRFNNQGVIHESYLSTRYVRHPNNGPFDLLAVTTKREKYPSVQIGTKTTNYRTGITTETRNLAFDFYSGQVTETYNEDGFGNKFATENVPAYHTYPSMKAFNMLTQEGETYVYRLKDGFDPDTYSYDYSDNLGSLRREAIGLVSASFQSWTQGVDIMEGTTRHSSSSVYRKHKVYSLTDPDNSQSGIADILEDGSFNIEIANGEIPTFRVNASNPTSGGWEQQSEITLYDIYSHALEAKDVNGNYASTKFDDNNLKILSTAANARYEANNYTGFEQANDGNIQLVTGSGDGRKTGRKHTGDYAMKLVNSSARAYYQLDDDSKHEYETYKVSFWSNNTGGTPQLYFRLNGGAESNITVQSSAEKSVMIDGNEWRLNTALIAPPENFTTYELGIKNSGGTVWIDDFRFYPLDAAMSSYVYNQWGELSDVLDANNLFTHYEYDAMGRLKSVTRETFSDGPVKISEAEIYYAQGAGEAPMYGEITSAAVGNTATLSVDFTNPGSNDLTYEWTVGSTTYSPSSENELVYNVTSGNSGHQDVIVTVTDNKYGTSFTNYKKVYFQYCQPYSTTPFSSFCVLDANACPTGYVIELFYNGDCSVRQVTRYDASVCDPLSCSTECPPNEICEIEDN